MKTIFEGIKTAIREHEKVKKSALYNINHWKRAHYIQLSTMISEEISRSHLLKGNRIYELGTSISFMTLKRFFENSYRDSAVNDLRFLKTLHKLCIFLGYYDLNDYIHNCYSTIENTDNEDCINETKSIILNFCEKEFEAIKQLPKIDTNELLAYSFKDSKIIKKVESYLSKYKDIGYTFDYSYDKASFKLLSCDIIKNNEDIMIVKTHEHWDMILKSKEKTLFYKVINYQTYFLKKDHQNQLKIWDNYNPDFDKAI